jgi:Protein of unknown function (DUF3352)
MRKLALLLILVFVPVLAALGCGKDEGASSATSLAPAGSLAYGEVDLEPSGDQQQAIEALAAKFPGEGSAGERLRSLIQEGLRDSDAPISFEQDVEPWLGDTAAFFVKGAQGQAAAALIATTDEDATRDALEKAFEGKAREKSYEGVDYLAAGDGAGGVVDGFLVVGTEAGFKEAVDTSDGGSALDGDERYDEATADIADDRLGLFYMNLPALLETVQRQPGAEAFRSFGDLFEDPVVATFDADRDGVTFEADAPASLASTMPFFGEGSDLVNELPADSWLALAQPDLGKVLDPYVEAFGQSVGGRDAVAGQFQALTGLDLDRDLLGWMGDFGVFVRGTSMADLGGAVVIETTDPGASARLIGRLQQLAKAQPGSGTTVEPLSTPGGGKGFTLRDDELPAPVHMFQRGDRVVVAYGDAAAEDALAPSDRLGDSPEFTDAAQSIDGYTVSFYLAMGPVLELADSAAAGDPEWSSARPYLEPLQALVGGTAGDNDELRSAFKILVE